MRRASQSLLIIMAGVIATAASAVALNSGNKPAAPALRAGSTGTAMVTVKAPRKAVLRTSAPILIQAAKPKVVAVKTPVRKVALKHQPVRKHFAKGSTISVPLDEVRVVAFSQPVSTIYVGNPTIADVSMIDARHAFVLGKGFGATNVVALDSDGKQIVNDAVNVYGHTGSIVILHRGVQQATYNCAGPRCETAPVPGDGKDSFGSGTEQMTQHQEAGIHAASAGR
ncbi:MAG: pilus assembly protein N-terminal domain-containing protein [Alphaproteobacteria bacterium]|nr:pilus assembly protein N-terminal domain-containing protein [Alphaproteobacteria bacterium]MBV9062615.1 pilus assembly protein N-terminal domain-containing protein [Alphaproteobacteria bacterium]